MTLPTVLTHALIMSGVMMHLDFDKRWILSAIPEAAITVVRMLGAEPTLLASRMASEDAEGIILPSVGSKKRPLTSPADSPPSESAHDLDNLATAVQKPGLEHIIR